MRVRYTRRLAKLAGLSEEERYPAPRFRGGQLLLEQLLGAL